MAKGMDEKQVELKKINSGSQKAYLQVFFSFAACKDDPVGTGRSQERAERKGRRCDEVEMAERG